MQVLTAAKGMCTNNRGHCATGVDHKWAPAALSSLTLDQGEVFDVSSLDWSTENLALDHLAGAGYDILTVFRAVQVRGRLQGMRIHTTVTGFNVSMRLY